MSDHRRPGTLWWPFDRWNRKQRLAAPSRFYGDGGTIHDTGWLDVEVHNGQVVGVWFRCQQLPYRVTHVTAQRHLDMTRTAGGDPCIITGVEVRDLPQ